MSKINGLKNIIIESFNHNSEEVKSAASYALGNISLGNLGDYVPFVLKEIQAQPKRQYLLLHSLKEIISAQSGSARSVQVLAPFVPAIWRQLFNHCECNEEGKKLNKTQVPVFWPRVFWNCDIILTKILLYSYFFEFRYQKCCCGMSGKIVFDQTRRIATPITRSSVLTISFNEVNFDFTKFLILQNHFSNIHHNIFWILGPQ